ncbi:hypothetical protein GQ53DRAFT_822093 [Thozetella sp. PMI_491]|nr:hypothetical protein GQ53DRAFT_822093 [Thozetella sp. PMI_491]
MTKPQLVRDLLSLRSEDDNSIVRVPMENSTFNPFANILIIRPGKAVRYEWPILADEHQELLKMLDPRYADGPQLQSTCVTNPQELCRHCSAPSTFSDLVRIALRDDIHDADFMIRGIRNNTPGKGEEHQADCKNCGEMYDGSNNWATAMTWGNVNTELCGQGSGS